MTVQTEQPKTSETPRRLRILLAEDDGEMRGLLALLLAREGHDVTESANGIQLVNELADCVLGQDEHLFDLVVSDIRMPGLTALEVLDGLKDVPGLPPVILITAFGAPETHQLAREFGAMATLDKPFPPDDLLSLVRQVASLPVVM